MENPIVVFVLRKKCGDKTLEFPTGWTAEGQRLNGAKEISGKDCSIILLEDDQDIPACNHKNKVAEQPLLVITHKNSVQYRPSTIAGTELANWGIPVCREIFSHDSFNDRTFQEILKMLNTPSSAISFARQRLMSNDLKVLDKLAAICQINMIDPSFDNIDLWGEHIKDAPTSKLKKDLRDAKKDWPAILKLIVDHANAIPSQPPV